MITNTMPRRRKESEHYVNNKEFLEALINYRAEVARSFEKSMVENPQKKIGQRGGTNCYLLLDTLEIVSEDC